MGDDVTGWHAEKISRQGLGRSFQKTNVFLPLTVWDNVRLAAQSRDAQQPWNPLLWFKSTQNATEFNSYSGKQIRRLQR